MSKQDIQVYNNFLFYFSEKKYSNNIFYEQIRLRKGIRTVATHEDSNLIEELEHKRSWTIHTKQIGEIYEKKINDNIYVMQIPKKL